MKMKIADGRRTFRGTVNKTNVLSRKKKNKERERGRRLMRWSRMHLK